jgi:uncharacterized membrane protein required for colicin V production
VDVVLLSVAVGTAILGALWGLVRMATALLAAAGGFFVARLAGPPLAALLFAPALGTGQKLLASLVAGGLAAAVLLASGTGVRKLLERLHLASLDRLLGALAAAGAALFLAALLLALAASAGWEPRGSLTPRLTQLGQHFLAVYSACAKSKTPQASPKSPTNSGQQPAGS